MPGDRREPAERVLRHALKGPTTLGAGRLICIDGPAGSGKTTLAEQIRELSGAVIVHLDDLYEGWSGLTNSGMATQIIRILVPLSQGTAGSHLRYDWERGEYAESHGIEPVPLLILEGVGSGNRMWSPLVTTLVWVEASPEVRSNRGLARDGEAMRARWLRWMEDEAQLFAKENTRKRADIKLNTSLLAR